MTDPLRNVGRASLILPELDKVARNVPSRKKKGMFTGHDAFARELAVRTEAFKKSCSDDGMLLSKAASLGGVPAMSREDSYFLLRAAAEEAMQKCAELGDAARFELCAEAAVALDAARELEKYAATGRMPKTAATQVVNTTVPPDFQVPQDSAGQAEGFSLKDLPGGTALAGAALGAIAGGGIKYALSSPEKRRMGLTRLLDASLLGAALGGGAGWYYDKLTGEEQAAAKEEARKHMTPEEKQSHTALRSDYVGQVAKADPSIQELIKQSQRQARRNAEWTQSPTFKILEGKENELDGYNRWRNRYGAAGVEKAIFLENLEMLKGHAAGLRKIAESVKDLKDEASKQVFAEMIAKAERAEQFHNDAAHRMANDWTHFQAPPGVGGEKPSGILGRVGGAMRTVGSDLYHNVVDSSSKAEARKDKVDSPEYFHSRFGDLMAIIQDNNKALGAE